VGNERDGKRETIHAESSPFRTVFRGKGGEMGTIGSVGKDHKSTVGAYETKRGELRGALSKDKDRIRSGKTITGAGKFFFPDLRNILKRA